MTDRTATIVVVLTALLLMVIGAVHHFGGQVRGQRSPTVRSPRSRREGARLADRKDGMTAPG